jgi:hypothetical protein
MYVCMQFDNSKQQYSGGRFTPFFYLFLGSINIFDILASFMYLCSLFSTFIKVK